MIDAAVQLGLTGRYQVGERHLPAICRCDLNGLQSLDPGPLCERHAEQNRHILFFLGLMEQADRHSFQGNLKSLVDLGGTDSVKGSLFFINHKIDQGLLIFHVPIDVHHPRGIFKNLDHFLGNLALAVIVRAVNFRNQRGQHRRTGWHLGDLNAGTKAFSNLLEPWSHALCNIMALGLAVVLVH